MIGGMTRAALALGVVVATTAADPPRDWRQVATLHDRQRLRDWRSSWLLALTEARAAGGAATLAADPALYAPDAALVDGALPPSGAYRCRRIALGSRSAGAAFLVGSWGRCRIDGDRAPPALAVLDGVQRPVGAIYPDSDRRAIFLGTSIIGDERRANGYGHAEGRDMAGVIERIGERRWRLVVPRPYFGSALDLIELVPE